MREKEHEEYNALTKRLLEEGYTVDNHPDYVRVDVPMWQEKTLDNYDGGFTYAALTLKVVFILPRQMEFYFLY